MRLNHGVLNKEEAKILNNLANGTVKLLAGQCPVRGCFTRVEHLKLHLRTHKELKRKEREVYMSRLRYKSAITLLRELRATNPEVPMASRLDITSHSQYPCTKRECIDRLKEFEEEVASLKAEVASLKRQIEELTDGQSTSSKLLLTYLKTSPPSLNSQTVKRRCPQSQMRSIRCFQNCMERKSLQSLR
ncbi:hypothetical protein WMY93_027835 [Mugilogobius chulae]|uniref:C2H2-type domain-containing protein n=1 Tax=Mugilogobius chulae TaxID=88201 RepID=A0AAW0N5Z9_9GOBI